MELKDYPEQEVQTDYLEDLIKAVKNPDRKSGL